MLEHYLDDLEKRIDPAVEEELLSEWKSFLDGKLTAGFFSPQRRRLAPASVAWPDVTVNQALASFESMALQQLWGCSDVLATGAGAIMNIRANFGTGTLSSLFGAEIFIMEDALNTLPTTKPLVGGTDAIRRLLDRPVPRLTAGYGEECFETYRLFSRLLANYPKVSRYVHLYHPDLQGPMDIAELLWGSGIFIDLIDGPDLVHALLEKVTETYIRFMREWEKIVPPRKGYSAHWGMMLRGRIMLRDDSAMNLSPAMFDEFIRPYDQRLLTEFGGGAVHFCGRGDHYIDRLSTMEGLHAVNLSQPHYNDMERIFQSTVDKGVALIGLKREVAEVALARGRDLRGLVHCS